MPTRFIGDGYWEIISRQMSVVSKSEQSRFKDAKIAVIGCGGIGGETIEMLARMGVGQLNLVDKDYFDVSNLNRQTLSSLKEVGLSKSEVGKDKVRLMNPYTKVNCFNEEVTEKNISKIVNDCDIVIDALDNLLTRIIVSRYCKQNEITFIHGAIHGTQGQLTVFLPENDIDYETMFSLPSKDKPLDKNTIAELNKLTNGVPPVIGPTPNLIGCLEAIEAFKLITGIGEIVKAPELLSFDLLNLKSFNIQTL